MSTNDIIFMLLDLAGALAVFLFAMKLMSEGLQKYAGSKLRHILTKITGKPLSGIRRPSSKAPPPQLLWPWDLREPGYSLSAVPLPW